MNGQFRPSGGAALRRALDLVLALVGLLLAAPLMMAIAVMVRLDTPGPVVFSQWRIGQRGRHFRLYKFRKFAEDQVGGLAVTLKSDSRMTRVGRLLERTKLDELPQLWNIFRGDMSIVGPRPETLDFSDCFSDAFCAVLDHKPGLFGPNQVLFCRESTLYPHDRDPHAFYRAVLFPAKARVDLAYFPRRTLASDLGWTARSVLAALGLQATDHSGMDGIADFLTWLRQRGEALPAAEVPTEQARHA